MTIAVTGATGQLGRLALAAWDVDASNDALFDDGGQLSKLIGRPTTPLVDAIRAALA